MDCTAHGVTKSWTRLSDFHFPFQRGNRAGALDLVGTSGAHDAVNSEVTVKRKRSIGHLQIWILPFLKKILEKV